MPTFLSATAPGFTAKLGVTEFGTVVADPSDRPWFVARAGDFDLSGPSFAVGLRLASGLARDLRMTMHACLKALAKHGVKDATGLQVFMTVAPDPNAVARLLPPAPREGNPPVPLA